MFCVEKYLIIFGSYSENKTNKIKQNKTTTLTYVFINTDLGESTVTQFISNANN